MQLAKVFNVISDHLHEKIKIFENSAAIYIYLIKIPRFCAFTKEQMDHLSLQGFLSVQNSKLTYLTLT